MNLGKKAPEASAVDDYVEGVTALGHTADYLVVNVSSPNTPGLRNLQSKKHLKRLMTRVIEARNAIEGGHKPPVLLKIAPDLEDADVANIAAAAKSAGVDGIIVSNTTVARPEAIAAHPHGAEAGGLSGKPLMDASTEMVSKMYRATGGKIPLSGAAASPTVETRTGRFAPGRRWCRCTPRSRTGTGDASEDEGGVGDLPSRGRVRVGRGCRRRGPSKETAMKRRKGR